MNKNYIKLLLLLLFLLLRLLFITFTIITIINRIAKSLFLKIIIQIQLNISNIKLCQGSTFGVEIIIIIIILCDTRLVAHLEI